MALFKKKNIFGSILIERKPANSPSVPDNMWAKCPNCKHILYTKDIGEEKVCPHCGYAFSNRCMAASSFDY